MARHCVLIALVCSALPVPAALDLGYCNENMNTGSVPSLDRTGHPNATLVQAQVFIRHGARVRWTAAPCWPNENTAYHCDLQVLLGTAPQGRSLAPGSLVYRKVTPAGQELLPGNCSLGQLVRPGWEMETRNGQALRDAYVGGLLSPEPNPSELYLRSDDNPRTLQSGMALFSAMYPQVRTTSNQPLVVDWHTGDEAMDSIPCNSNQICPALPNATALSRDTREFVEHFKYTAALRDKLTPLTSVFHDSSITGTLTGFDTLLDCVYSHACGTVPSEPSGGSSIPLSMELQQQLVDEATWQMYFPMNDSAVQRLSVGPLLKQLVASASTRLNHTANEPKFLLYSGHDIGPIGNLLAAYKIGDGLWPRFASLLAIELYENTGTASQSAVRLVYNGRVQHIPGCSDSAGMCDWVQFREISEAMIPSTTECPGME